MPCRLSVRWGLHRFACMREVDAPCSCRPFGGRLLRSGWRPAFRPVAAPSVGDLCARLCKTCPDGSFTVRERGPPTLAEEAERCGESAVVSRSPGAAGRGGIPDLR